MAVQCGRQLLAGTTSSWLYQLAATHKAPTTPPGHVSGAVRKEKWALVILSSSHSLYVGYRGGLVWVHHGDQVHGAQAHRSRLRACKKKAPAFWRFGSLTTIFRCGEPQTDDWRIAVHGGRPVCTHLLLQPTGIAENLGVGRCYARPGVQSVLG